MRIDGAQRAAVLNNSRKKALRTLDMPDNKNTETREKTGPRRALLKTARLSLSGARKDRRRP